MSDSTQQDNEGFIEFTHRVNKALRGFFNAKREQIALSYQENQAIDEVKTRYAELKQPHAEKEARLKQELIDIIWPMKHLLITGKRKSVSTPYGNIEFKQKTADWTLKNADGLLELVRKDRRVTELFERVVDLKPRTTLLKKLMKTDEKFRKRYSPFFEQIGGYDELRVRPSDRYFKRFDKNRLTDESENLGAQPTNDVQDTSPDA